MNDKKNKFEKSLELIAKSSVFIFFGVIFSKLMSYFYRVIIARSFGPEIYGLFSIAIMISGWFMAFALLGVNSGLFRYIAFYRGKKEINKIKHLYKISSIFLFFTSIISMVALYLLSEFIAINIFHNNNLTIFLKLFSISIPLSIYSQSFYSIMLAYEKTSWYTSIFHFLTNIIKVSSLLIFIFIGLQVNSVIFSYILGILSACIAIYFLTKYKLSEIFGKYHLDIKTKTKIKKELFSYSWPFVFSSIILFIFYWTDSFIIGFFKTATDVGYYNVAIPIALLLTLAPEIFLRLFFPLITKEYSKNNMEIIKELSKQVVKWVFILNLPIFVLILIFPSEIITILFGVEYIVATKALMILAFGTFFSTLLIVPRHLLEMVGKSKLILIDTAILATLNIILNILLVPKYGISGAALSTTISFMILSIIFLIQANHYTNIIPIRRKMGKILLILIIPTLLTLFLKGLFEINLLTFLILSSFFFLLYLILILLGNGLDENDFRVLKSFKRVFSKK